MGTSKLNSDGCTFSFSDLKRQLPELLDSIIIPLPFVKRATSHNCLRYINGYRIGLIGPELDYAIKGHRMIPQENLQLFNEDEFNKQQDEKMEFVI